jgi:hypothetical protein
MRTAGCPVFELVKKETDLILRSALARLEGWRHGRDSRPSFETRA